MDGVELDFHKENGPKFFAYLEYKERLSVAQIVVNLPKVSRENSVFVIERNGLTLRKANSKLVSRISFKGLNLVPPSCHGMQWISDGELQMRIQARKPQGPDAKIRRRERVLSGESLNGEDLEIQVETQKLPQRVSSNWCTITKGTSCSLLCGFCSTVVLDNHRFERVLPLPTDQWEELSDTWFCCKHNTDKCVDMQQSMAPSIHDCFYGDTCLIVLYTALRESAARRLDDGTIQCSRCRNVLGRASKTKNDSSEAQTDPTVVLNRFNLIIENGEPDILSSIPHSRKHWLSRFEEAFTGILLNQAEKHNCFRFVIEQKTGSNPSKPFLLIWLMDQDNIIYQATVSGTPVEVTSPQSVAKVIYKDCIGDASLASQWMKDLGAQCIQLPDVHCGSLLQLLISHSEELPMCLRNANSFLVSYLETGRTVELLT